jgi:hypothetical protein
LLRFRLFVRYLPELTPYVWVYWPLRYRRVLMLLASSMEAEAGPKVSLLIVGRLHGVTRKRLRAVVEQIGGELASRPSSRVDTIALAHGSAPSVLRDAPRLTLPTGVGPAAKVISELSLKRMLGLVQPAADQDRTLDEADLMRASKLPADMLACLAAFDVLEPIDGRFIYQDVLVAREVGRLLGRGYSLAAIVAAAVALRRSRVSLSQVRLVEAPWGDLVQDIEGMLAGLDGQLALPLAHPTADSGELFERAEMLEAAGDLAAAERSYRAALAIDRADPALPYNLANVLDEQDRRHDAILAYYEALRRDPDFAEAAVASLARARDCMWFCKRKGAWLRGGRFPGGGCRQGRAPERNRFGRERGPRCLSARVGQDHDHLSRESRRDGPSVRPRCENDTASIRGKCPTS